MTDRELLELAAKAAGIRVNIQKPDMHGFFTARTHAGAFWNPLTDDGDALRLAVTLNMNVYVGEAYPWRRSTADYGPGSICDQDECADPFAATRLAITRAAAEIGRAMP